VDDGLEGVGLSGVQGLVPQEADAAVLGVVPARGSQPALVSLFVMRVSWAPVLSSATVSRYVASLGPDMS
jgi:hypothetical protein